MPYLRYCFNEKKGCFERKMVDPVLVDTSENRDTGIYKNLSDYSDYTPSVNTINAQNAAGRVGRYDSQDGTLGIDLTPLRNGSLESSEVDTMKNIFNRQIEDSLEKSEKLNDSLDKKLKDSVSQAANDNASSDGSSE